MWATQVASSKARHVVLSAVCGLRCIILPDWLQWRPPAAIWQHLMTALFLSFL